MTTSRDEILTLGDSNITYRIKWDAGAIVTITEELLASYICDDKIDFYLGVEVTDFTKYLKLLAEIEAVALGANRNWMKW